MFKQMGGEKMSNIIVYHGSTLVVEHPICMYGRPNLDFGQGFYVTNLRKQATEWALLVAGKRQAIPVLNKYVLCRDEILTNARCKIFNAYDSEWLEFIVSSRLGNNPSKDYDYIEGGIANDRVIDTVNLFMAGLMDSRTALSRLAVHSPNNQMCLLSQEITDNYLLFDGTESI